MSDHATHSSHVTDHFLSTLLSLSYMRCIACCWKSRLTPAVLCWKARQDAAAPPAAPCVPPAYPGRTRLQIVSYCIVSRYFVGYRIVSIVFPYGCVVPSLKKSVQIQQVPQLSQRDCCAGWVSYGRKWKTGNERQYLRTL